MKYPNIDNFEYDDQYFEKIYPNIWLMDDHKWAYYIWEKYRSERDLKLPKTLAHLDFHWDGINDFHERPVEEAELLAIDDLSSIYEMVSGKDPRKHHVKKDSFIAPAVIRRIINEVHFYCLQSNTEIG